MRASFPQVGGAGSVATITNDINRKDRRGFPGKLRHAATSGRNLKDRKKRTRLGSYRQGNHCGLSQRLAVRRASLANPALDATDCGFLREADASPAIAKIPSGNSMSRSAKKR